LNPEYHVTLFLRRVPLGLLAGIPFGCQALSMTDPEILRSSERQRESPMVAQGEMKTGSDTRYRRYERLSFTLL
jgi:hypothetical protein